MNKKSPKELRELIEQFVSRNPHFKPRTQMDDRYAISKTLSFLEKGAWENGLPVNIDQDTIIRWVKKMGMYYDGLHTIMPRMRRVSAFFQFLKDNGHIGENPLEVLRMQYPNGGLKAVILTILEPSPEVSLERLKSVQKFISPLGLSMQKFIAHGRAQGNKYYTEEELLCRFDRFLMSLPGPPEHLCDSILKQWINLFSGKSDAHRYKNFDVVKRFCLYLRRFDPGVYVPDKFLNPPYPKTPIPHIYSKEEIITILEALRSSKPSRQFALRPQMLYHIVLLLYTTGMRFSEVMNLRLKDIDWSEEKICIRETKFFKSRLVPLSHSTAKELKTYLQLSKRSGFPTTSETFLFQNQHTQKPYCKSTIGRLFRQTLADLGLKKQGYSGPCIHHLRHTFAVHRLEKWYLQGEDVQKKLGLISTYLGHVGIGCTQRYLTMTSELLYQASRRFNQDFQS